MVETVEEKMDTQESVQPALSEIDKNKENLLFDKLYKNRENLNKCLANALTIQSMYKKDLKILIRLFEFFKEVNQLDMAYDLCENDLLKNFNLIESNLFDAHFNKFGAQIIQNLSIKSPSQSGQLDQSKLNKPDSNDEFYFKLFIKLSQASQENLVKQLLDKYQSSFAFLKPFIESAATDKKPAQQAPQMVDVKDFYVNLAKNRETLFMIRDLLLIYRKFIPDYGLYFIDGFLNVEKHLFANLVQKNPSGQFESNFTNIEKRSLNLMRRLCVIDLIPEFVHLIEKPDNRYCYRWIEKCLEFYCKYLINSIEINKQSDNLVSFNYITTTLVYDSELLIGESNENMQTDDEILKMVKANLGDLIEFQYKPSAAFNDNNTSPFYYVYKLLDEIGKKLTWPPIQSSVPTSSLPIEDKLTYLLNLKSKNDKQISISSLNKQISFYGLAAFFNKVIEFQALSKHTFSDMLVLSQTFNNTDTPQSNSKPFKVNKDLSFDPVEFTISNIVYCLKLWQKFNQHKELFTIISKCLSNSKLDSLSCYKSFLSEYYNSFALGLNLMSSQNLTWGSFDNFNIKQKISVIANLFMSEKTSFQNFFNEFNKLVEEVVKKQTDSNTTKFYGSLVLSKTNFDLFELGLDNLVKYFSKVMLTKIVQMYDHKKTAILNALSNNDLFMGHIVVLLQINFQTTNASSQFSDFYDTIFQAIKSKGSFSYEDFFDYIFDIQILQDFYMLFNSNSSKQSFKLSKEANLDVSSKFLNQINLNMSKEIQQRLNDFLTTNTNSLTNMFDQLVKL